MIFSAIRPVRNGSKIERELVEFSAPLLNRIKDEIYNNIKPDLALNLGDLIEDFNDHDIDITNLKFIWNKFQKINVSFYSCIGNHDLRTVSSRTEVEQIMGYEHSTFSFDIAGIHIVFLGTLNMTNSK